jgi:hypothetical protein
MDSILVLFQFEMKKIGLPIQTQKKPSKIQKTQKKPAYTHTDVRKQEDSTQALTYIYTYTHIYKYKLRRQTNK